jgi:hypothetical protein
LRTFERIFVGDFLVRTVAVDLERLTIAVQTEPGRHPLEGWRYWRVFQRAPGRVVVETGAVDRPARGLMYFLGFYFDKTLQGLQLLTWEEYLEFAIDRTGAAHAVNPTYPINGVWNQNPNYVRSAICAQVSVSVCQ